VTPHKHDLACKKYEHGGGPIKRPGGSGMPVGMLGKQVQYTRLVMKPQKQGFGFAPGVFLCCCFTSCGANN
jgi:hypothetical protein